MHRRFFDQRQQDELKLPAAKRPPPPSAGAPRPARVHRGAHGPERLRKAAFAERAAPMPPSPFVSAIHGNVSS